MSRDPEKPNLTKDPDDPKPNDVGRQGRKSPTERLEEGHPNMTSGGMQKTKSDDLKRPQMER